MKIFYIRVVLLLFILILGFTAWYIGLPWQNNSFESIKILSFEAPLKYHVYFGLWIGSILNIVLLIPLIIFANKWAKKFCEIKTKISWPQDELTNSHRNPINNKNRKVFSKLNVNIISYILILLISITILINFASKRLEHSFWLDEHTTYVNHIHGSAKRGERFEKEKFLKLKDGDRINSTVAFAKLYWIDTIWGYSTTNNHILFSILSRISLNIWFKFMAPEDSKIYAFSESAIRFPSLIAGVLGIIFWALFFKKINLTIYGLIFAIFLSFNPWYIRFSSEARGYSLVLMFLPLLLIYTIKVVKYSKWKDWSLYGLFQVLMLYTWPAMAINVALLNLALLYVFWIISKKEGKSWFWQQITRYAVINYLSVIFLIQLYLPCFVQLYGYVTYVILKLDMWTNWYQNLMSFLVLGIETNDYYKRIGQFNDVYQSLESINIFNFSIISVIKIYYIIAFLGFLRLMFHQFVRFLIIPLFIPFIILQSSSSFKGTYIFPWYYFYWIVFALIFFIAGSSTIINFSSKFIIKLFNKYLTNKQFFYNFFKATMLSVVISSYTYFTIPVIQNITINEIEQMSRSSKISHAGQASFYDNEKNARSRLVAYLRYLPDAYDPYSYILTSIYGGDDFAPSLMRLMRWSDKFQLPLSIVVGAANVTRLNEKNDKLFKWIDNKKYFVKIATLSSIIKVYKREIYLYKGGFFKKNK